MSSLRLPCFSPVPSQLLTPNDYPTQLLDLLASASRQPVGKMTLAHFLKKCDTTNIHIYHGVMSFLRCCVILTEWLPSPISHRHHLWSSVIESTKLKLFLIDEAALGHPPLEILGVEGKIGSVLEPKANLQETSCYDRCKYACKWKLLVNIQSKWKI